ncbi:MAG: putative toxin-antitoxin system toxin component, PIN family [Betaproteobacteria bacterium]|nr:putative toxin-antitoxin system toxin component, PIN family [Betaproteobacteria bacterium]
MRVVLDTNVLVSGLARSTGAPGRVIEAWRAGEFDLVVSDALLDEAGRVFAYSRVRILLEKGGITTAMVGEFLEIIRFKAITVATANVAVPATPPDAGDLHVVQAFVASGAEFLVTGDRRDLLSLGLPGVVSVSEFERRLTALRFR